MSKSGLDIDVQGGKQIAQKLPHAVLVFIAPPSMEVLEARLRGRKSDSEEAIQRRLSEAQQEIQAAKFYTHHVVNDVFDDAVAALVGIIEKARAEQDVS